MAKILWINPIGTDLFDKPIEEYLNNIKLPDTCLTVVSFPDGPIHNEYNCYEMLMAPTLLRVLYQAEKDGFDAAIIGCFYDPCLRAAREITSRMMVTAPAESCLSIASTLGERISIIVGRDKWILEMHENVVKYGCKDKVASFKSLGLGVHDFQKNPDYTREKMIKAAREAVEKDGADVIILGCTIEFGFFQDLQKVIRIPVLDAAVAPFKYAEFLADIKQRFGWGHSKITGYESPPEHEIQQFFGNHNR